MLISGMNKLGISPLSLVLGEDYQSRWVDIRRIKKYRNKIMHGQHTGQDIRSPQLEKDVTGFNLGFNLERGYFFFSEIDKIPKQALS